MDNMVDESAVNANPAATEATEAGENPSLAELGVSSGPPSLGLAIGPPSPLTGCYLLIVIGEPYTQEHKGIILQKLVKGKSSSSTSAVTTKKNIFHAGRVPEYEYHFIIIAHNLLSLTSAFSFFQKPTRPPY